jgi:desulfoferrodoxin (superoxide reductase-like protein)
MLSGLLLLSMLAMAMGAAAHPPSGMTIIYNDRLDVLTVSIDHDVKDRTTHYVEKIEVWIGNSQVIERTFTEQPRDKYNERFTLNTEEGDQVTVKAYCNIEGMVERTMTIGPGITAEGDQADTLGMMLYVHAALQVLGLVLAFVAIPGGLHFYNAWRAKRKPTGKRRRHVRIGWAVVGLWGLGAVGGMWTVYMTSGDYLGSPHGWMAFATFGAALFASYSASPSFRKAGYGMRMQAHMPLSLLTIVLGVITILGGMMTAGMI